MSETDIIVPRQADYALIERRYDTSGWEAEDYRNAQDDYAKWIEAAHPGTLTDEAKLRRSQALDELGALDGEEIAATSKSDFQAELKRREDLAP